MQGGRADAGSGRQIQLSATDQRFFAEGLDRALGAHCGDAGGVDDAAQHLDTARSAGGNINPPFVLADKLNRDRPVSRHGMTVLDLLADRALEIDGEGLLAVPGGINIFVDLLRAGVGVDTLDPVVLVGVARGLLRVAGVEVVARLLLQRGLLLDLHRVPGPGVRGAQWDEEPGALNDPLLRDLFLSQAHRPAKSPAAGGVVVPGLAKAVVGLPRGLRGAGAAVIGGDVKAIAGHLVQRDADFELGPLGAVLVVLRRNVQRLGDRRLPVRCCVDELVIAAHVAPAGVVAAGHPDDVARADALGALVGDEVRRWRCGGELRLVLQHHHTGAALGRIDVVDDDVVVRCVGDLDLAVTAQGADRAVGGIDDVAGKVDVAAADGDVGDHDGAGLTVHTALVGHREQRVLRRGVLQLEGAGRVGA